MPIAIVTGGNSGIGRATAVRLAKDGFDVGFTWHRDEERADSAIEEIGEQGGRAEAVHADLHDVRAGGRAVDELAERLGGVDVFVSNAGYGTDKPVVELALEEWQGVLDVNLTAAFLGTQAAARRMIDQGRGGRIVIVSSVHEHIPLTGNAPYSVSKHGLGGLVKVAAVELGEHGILVNSVAPGQIATRMTGQEDDSPAGSDVPLGRAGTAHEIAGMISWLAGPDATYATGASFLVDGGLQLIAADHQ